MSFDNCKERPTNYVALWGKKGAGKTTVAQALRGAMSVGPNKVQVKSLSQPLKEAFRLLFNKDWSSLTGEEKEFYRPFMQGCGDLVWRFEKDYFAKKIVESASLLDYVIVDDLRYIRELNVLAKNANRIVVIKIEGPNEDHNDEHSSELGIGLSDVTDYTWTNNMTHMEGEGLLDLLIEIGFYKTGE